MWRMRVVQVVLTPDQKSTMVLKNFLMIFWPKGMYEAMYQTSAHHWKKMHTRMSGTGAFMKASVSVRIIIVK